MSESGHGHSVAAWTGVVILLLASAILAVGIYFGWGWTYWVGSAVAVVGVAAWYGLAAAGFGEKAHDSAAAHH